MKTYVTESLGPKQSYTPEGYLRCDDVPIARTGIMVYGPYELSDERGELLEPGKDGVIYVTRDADELFNDRTISSIEAKSITVRHPATVTQLVNSGNWNSVTSGVGQNVRRGTGDKSDFLLADLLITSKDAIDLVRSKRLREVSLGYVANYKQTKPGLAQQTDIIGNHIALVEAGRCGALCSIGDTKMDVVLNHQKEALRRAFNTRDAALFARALDDFGDKEKSPPDQYTDSEPGKTETPSGFENGGGGKPPPKDEGGDVASGTHHHVTVNLHGVSGNQAAPGASTDPSDMSTGSPAEGGATQEGVDPANPDAGGGDPGAGQDPVEMIMGAIKKLEMRVSSIEQVIGGGQAPQPQQAAPKPPAQAQGGGPMGGNFPPKKQQTQDQDTSAGEGVSDDTDDTASAGAVTSDDGTEGPSGAPGPELGHDMSLKGVGEKAEGHGGPDPANKDAPLLRTEPDADGDHSGQDQLPKKVTGDTMYVPDGMEAVRRREAWTETLSRAEMLMPGVRLPTFDAALDENKANDMLCSFKRKVIAASFETDRGGQAIRGFVTSDSPNFTRMTCDAVDVLFAAASERMRERNNIMSVDRGPAFVPEHAKGKRPQTPAEINAFNRAFYEARDRGF